MSPRSALSTRWICSEMETHIMNEHFLSKGKKDTLSNFWQKKFKQQMYMFMALNSALRVHYRPLSSVCLLWERLGEGIKCLPYCCSWNKTMWSVLKLPSSIIALNLKEKNSIFHLFSYKKRKTTSFKHGVFKITHTECCGGPV